MLDDSCWEGVEGLEVLLSAAMQRFQQQKLSTESQLKIMYANFNKANSES